MEYNKSNVFGKIISGEVQCDKVLESEHTIIINDKFPVAPIHLLAIPKKACVDYYDFTCNAENEEILDYFSSIANIIKKMRLDKKHYRLISNSGSQSGQTIFHFHTHIISGKQISKLI